MNRVQYLVHIYESFPPALAGGGRYFIMVFPLHWEIKLLLLLFPIILPAFHIRVQRAFRTQLRGALGWLEYA